MGWRLFGVDAPDIAFNLYRTTDAGKPVKLNTSPLVATTDFIDRTVDPTRANTYTVRAVVARQGTSGQCPVHARGQRPCPAIPDRAASTACRRRSGRASGRALSEVHLQRERRHRRRPRRRRRVRDRLEMGSVEFARHRVRRTRRSGAHRRLSTRRHAACGGSIWAGTFAPAHTTRSSSSSISTATAGPSWRARRQTDRSTARAA